MKKTLAALALGAWLTGSAASAGEIINFTRVEPTVNDAGKSVMVLPDKNKTKRRRMLVDFGLFGTGLHIGWLKPKNVDVMDSAVGTASDTTAGNGGEEGQPASASATHRLTIKQHRFRIGSPIFNVSAGKHAFGLGTR